MEEYYHQIYRRRVFDKKGIRRFGPFYNYIHWKENDIAVVTEELNWQHNAHAKSSWKADCRIAPLKSYMYRSILGFDDKDDHFSWLIRDGQISREEALDRIQNEENVPQEMIESLVVELGINYHDFKRAVNKAVRI